MMGLWDSVKKGVKTLAKKTGELLDRTAREMKYRSAVKRLKLMLLMRFTKDQLEQVAAWYGVSLYVYPDPLSERAVRLRSKVDIAEHLAGKLSYNEVIAAAQRFHIKYRDIEEERERIYNELFMNAPISEQQAAKAIEEAHGSDIPTTQATQQAQPAQDPYYTAMLQLKDILQHEFVPEPVRDEAEFKKQVVKFLEGRLGRENVRQEVGIMGRRVDILLWNTIAVELKLARGQSSLNNLIGEVLKLQRAGVQYVMAVIMDIGKYPNLHQDIADLREMGVVPVVIRGQLKKPGRKRLTVEFR